MALKSADRLKPAQGAAEIPVMMLSERDKAEGSVKAFKSGADDYVAEPFNPLELRARIGMVLRRIQI